MTRQKSASPAANSSARQGSAKYYLRWGAGFLSLALGLLWLTWHLSAQCQFFYGFWYQQLGIDQTIATYAPQNRYIHGFEHTTESERLRLFAAINQAVHQQGEGLAQIEFYNPVTEQHRPMLRKPEIVHLQDVANLIDKVYLLGATASAVAITLLGFALLRREPLPPLGRLHLWGVGVLLTGLVVVLLIGAERVFYQFHEWIFPPGHPWFFYYQDSLMSTSMQAPNLFGAIAVQLLLSWLALYALALWLLRRCFPGT